MPKKPIPIACSLNDAEFRTRRAGVLAEIKEGIRATDELKNGFRFTFPADDDWVRKITEMIVLERACCPFLNFNLKIGAGGETVTLKLSGRAGAKEFVASLFL
jgi:hypothetical protein